MRYYTRGHLSFVKPRIRMEREKKEVLLTDPSLTKLFAI